MTRAEQAVALIAPFLGGRDLLEVACGSAEFSLAAAEIAAEVTCIDLDDSRLLPEMSGCGNLHFFPMDAAAMCFDSERFDIALLYNAVFHLESQLPAILDECLRVLRPGGVIYATSSWSLDKPVLTDTLLPLAAQRGLTYRLSVNEPFMSVRMRR